MAGTEEVLATYENTGGTSTVYVYVTAKENFPINPNTNMYTETRNDQEIIIDREQGTDKILGVEIIFDTRREDPNWTPIRKA